MSQQLISRSPDLKKLQDEGYDVEVRAGHLLLKQIPYVNSKKEVKRGTLVAALDLAGDVTARPSTHVALFSGEHPCNKDGSEIAQIKHQSEQKKLDKDLVVDHSFSSKPSAGYSDYYEKMTTYALIISSQAESIDPGATARVFAVTEANEDESVFCYMDTASSRAQINVVTRKLQLGKVAIVGLGGTGSYVLDLVAKTPVNELHLFDGDTFAQHNAFRSPGAPSISELRGRPKKVNYFRDLYSKMRRHLIAHDSYIDESNVDQLRGMDFVFLCLDSGESKKLILKKLEEFGARFVDVGMGVTLLGDSLLGILRVTTSTPEMRGHVWDKNRIPLSGDDANNEYSRNIQIADLNALNAALAVVKWKKLFGFYNDSEKEHFSAYTIDGNHLLNEDQNEDKTSKA